MPIKTDGVFTEDEGGDRTDIQIACTAPAQASDALRVIASSTTSGDGRSEFFWMRFADGTLILCCYPQGDTYMEFSDAGVCDFDWHGRAPR
jgi:hypothetical protein